ncbi:MAG: hypothetical protein M5U25_11290 [Planctomycetota bacterium]|nr:hypothetical protein [Planctomycetota bacterium]
MVDWNHVRRSAIGALGDSRPHAYRDAEDLVHDAVLYLLLKKDVERLSELEVIKLIVRKALLLRIDAYRKEQRRRARLFNRLGASEN